MVGFVGGYAGIGGAPILVFLLGTFLAYSQHVAQGTVVAIMLGPMSLLGVWVMWDRVKPQLRYVGVGVVTYAILSYAGASLAYLFSEDKLRGLFAILLFVIGARHFVSYWTEPAQGEAKAVFRLNLVSMTVLGSLVGLVGGLFGIGAGVLLVPLLTWLFGAHKDDARALSLAILLPPVSIGAVLRYHAAGDILWPMAGVGFVAYAASNFWGAKLGRAHRSRRFKAVMGLLLLGMGALYAFL